MESYLKSKILHNVLCTEFQNDYYILKFILSYFIGLFINNTPYRNKFNKTYIFLQIFSGLQNPFENKWCNLSVNGSFRKILLYKLLSVQYVPGRELKAIYFSETMILFNQFYLRFWLHVFYGMRTENLVKPSIMIYVKIHGIY